MDLSDGAAVLSREEVDEILRTQRKGNRKKACFPCHQRKVGCDGSRPCKRCVERDHLAMCSYEPVESEKKKRKVASMEPVTISPAQRTTVMTPMSKTTTPVSVARNQDSGPSSTSTDQFVGDSSIPSFILDGLSPAGQKGFGMNHNELRDVLLPALGLQQSAYGSSTKSAEATSAMLRVMEALPRSPEVIRSVIKHGTKVIHNIFSYA
jgi:hypothetical protein